MATREYLILICMSATFLIGFLVMWFYSRNLCWFVPQETGWK